MIGRRVASPLQKDGLVPTTALGVADRSILLNDLGIQRNVASWMRVYRATDAAASV
jgi:hypothetical protein